MKENLWDWFINEEDVPMGGATGSPDVGMQQASQVPDPNADPNMAPESDPNAVDQNIDPNSEAPTDINDDPQVPDMPDDQNDQDFEQWKNNFFKESIKGDTQKLMDLIHEVRDEELDAYPRKFVEDNLQVLFLRQHANIMKASDQIRNLLKQELNQNNPANSVVNHMFTVLRTVPELNNVFIKLKGMLGMKSDLHRKYIAALTGSVQVGSGGNNEDVIFNQKDYSIRMSTRFNDKWGRVDLGKWCLKEDDPERFLTDPELKRLENGSPDERESLRKRIIIESIAETFKTRSFIINVTAQDGTIFTLGWDLSSSIKDAYASGKLIVKTIQSNNSEAMLNDDGAIVPFVDVKIKYTKSTGELDEDGKPMKEEHDFLERIDGVLFLTAQLPILKDASTSFQGLVLKDTPYNGNPSDLNTLMRCVPSSSELLMRNC